MDIAHFLTNELKISLPQIQSAVTLLDEGATVPFISRYRKEVTGGLSDTDLRNIEERLSYLRELDARRNTILASITEQNKLTPELETAILATANKAELEDLYLPYKPKRRTKAQIAREAGLEPLATQLLQDPTLSPQEVAASFIDSEKGINTVAEGLEGAKQILIEQFSENASLLAEFRAFIWNNALIKTEVMKDKEVVGNKFSDYFTYQEALKKIPSHRALAIFRAQQEEILRIELFLEDIQSDFCKQRICQAFNIQDKNRPADSWLIEVASWTWRIKFALKLELELLSQLRENAEEEAIKVFANNLKHLLMASPAGSKVTLGLDPGFRTGVKTVVVDGTGKLLHFETIFPHQPRNDWDGSIHKLSQICKKFNVNLVSIGNGTASRETDKLASELQKKLPELNMKTIVVSEAGASVYSASEYAAKEFPDLDVTFRGAVSIARRLQDPLAELVKIEPKAIGVGQYQHDVNQFKLSRQLKAVMEDCVNAVGVDVNTASVPLLTCVAGLNESIAKNIILFRDENGPFKARQQFKKVARLGEKAFEQAAGFLRIVNGDNPLDSSAVHPEAYSVVEDILSKQQKKISDLMGNTQALRTLRAADYVNDAFGLPTVTDIIQELEKPGRDPRPEFKTATFKEGIETLADLKTGMVLEGVVTNVANFGAFVDIGVHQDGLVHKSMLGHRFVKDPHEVIKVNDIVKVKVLEIDVLRKRVQLTMRLEETAQPVAKQYVAPNAKQKFFMSKSAPMESGFASALLQAINKK